MAITHSNKSITGKHFRKRARKNAQKAVELKSVRYILSGGTAATVDIGSYYLCLHYLLKQTDINLGLFTVSFPIAALLFSYSCGFITSFTLSKFFVFKGSDMRTQHQLVRFTVVAAAAFVMNYILMKVLITWLGIYPTVARIVSTGLVAVVNYTIHNAFTFKVKGNKSKQPPIA